MPRIDERQEDDFFRSASESDSFSSGEDNVPAPDLREVKKKSKIKSDSQRDKPPISSKRVTKPPEPALEAEIQEERFVAVKAESLFDISEGEEQENPEEQGENERFFQPEDKNDDSEDEDAKTDSKKHTKRQRDNNDENDSESEDENEKRGITKTKAVSTAVSTFLNHKEPGKESKKEATRQETGPEEDEEQRIGNEETEEKEEQDDEDDDDEDESEEDEEEEEDDNKEKEGEDEEEEEPRVEFTGDPKPEVRFNASFGLSRHFFQEYLED